MTSAMLTLQIDTETHPSSEVFLLSTSKNIETKSDASTYFYNMASVGFELEGNNQINYYSTYNVLPLINNNYLSLFLKKLPFNYRIYSAEGTYINMESLNFIFNLIQPDETDSENNDSILEISLINIEKLSSIHSFLTQLKKKDNEDNEISGMKDIFLRVDEFVDLKDYNSIDELIRSFISLDFSFQFHISLLASTLRIKQLVNNRTKLVENALIVGASLMTDEELQLTLQGLT